MAVLRRSAGSFLYHVIPAERAAQGYRPPGGHRLPLDAEEAAGKDVWLDPADYPELSGTDAHTITEDGLTLEDLIGFSLLDQDGRRAGTIGDIQDFSGNICLELTGSGALVPFHDDLIIDIDIEKKTLTMSISEGLL